MEALFKITFFIAILVFCILVIGVFLLGIKILLLFTDKVELLGITFA